MSNEKKAIMRAKPFIAEQRATLAPLIPINADDRAFLNGAYLAIEENKDLRALLQTQEGRSTMVSALQRAATVGLSLNPIEGLAGFIPYGGKIRYQIYKDGLVEIALRNAQLKEFRTRIVYQNDQLAIGETESGDTYTYQKAIDDPGDPKGYLAVATLPNGTVRVHYMTKAQVEDWRDQYAMKKKDGDFAPLWKKFFDGAAQKTVARQLLTKLKIATPNDDYDPKPREIEIEPVKGTSAADVKADLAERQAEIVEDEIVEDDDGPNVGDAF